MCFPAIRVIGEGWAMRLGERQNGNGGKTIFRGLKGCRVAKGFVGFYSFFFANRTGSNGLIRKHVLLWGRHPAP